MNPASPWPATVIAPAGSALPPLYKALAEPSRNRVLLAAQGAIGAAWLTFAALVAPRHPLAAWLWLAAGGLLVLAWQMQQRRARRRRREAGRRQLVDTAWQARRRRERAHRGAATRAASQRELLRELHDGLGQRLLGAVHLARRLEVPAGALIDDAQVRQLALLRADLEAALADVHMVLRATDAPALPLGPALDDLREAMQMLHEDAGRTLEWRQAPNLAALTPEPALRLRLLRLLRELLKELASAQGAGAALRVDLGLAEGESGLHLRVVVHDLERGHSADDGIAVLRHAGGAARLQRLASDLGAHWDWRQADAGWRLALVLPLAAV